MALWSRKDSKSMNTNVLLIVVAGVCLVLYLMRRRARLGRDDE
jgi:hypothetical protein